MEGRELTESSREWPSRVIPYFTTPAPNDPISVLDGPFRIMGREEGVLESDLVFRWTPSPELSFDGLCSLLHVPADFDQEWHLAYGESGFEIPVLLTHIELLQAGSRIRGDVNGMVGLGESSFEVLRFTLANFPLYMGAPISYTVGETRGSAAGRLEVSDASGTCMLDVIPESSGLAREARRGSGYVLTHVGQWVPAAGSMTPAEATETLQMLHAWFTLLRGARSGPLFSQGLMDDVVTWRELAHWNVSDGWEVPTWMPKLSSLDLSTLFAGFSEKWHDEAWRRPLTTALWWLGEANAHETAIQSRILLSQVALELLSWVHVVETQRLCSRSGFNGLSASDRIRYLLQSADIPTAVPDHMSHAAELCDNDAYDGPGIVTLVRNALVHATERKRAKLDSLDGLTWWECSQLAIQYVELVLLSLCGYDGVYAQRGYRGWQGEEEAPVPWATAPADATD